MNNIKLILLLAFLLSNNNILTSKPMWEACDSLNAWNYQTFGMESYDSTTFIKYGSWGKEKGDSAFLDITYDYGETWKRIYGAEPQGHQGAILNPYIRDISIISKSSIVISLRDFPSKILRTDDKGKTWKDITPKPYLPYDLKKKLSDSYHYVHFKDSLNGFSWHREDTFHITTNGGKTWQEKYFGIDLPENETYNLNGFDFDGDDLIFGVYSISASSKNPYPNKIRKLLISHDFAETWNCIDDVLDTLLYPNIALLDKYRITHKFGENGRIWQAGNKGFIGVEQESAIWASVSYSDDEGKTWTDIPMIAQDSDSIFASPYFKPGFSVFENGKILIYDSAIGPYRSVDGGETWNKDSVYIPDYYKIGRRINHFAMATPSRGMICATSQPVVTFRYMLYPVSVVDNQYHNSNNIFFSPNPIRRGQTLNISLSQSFLNYSTKIYNIEGILVAEYENQSSIQITNIYTTGTYFIVIESNGRIISRNKFIVR